MKKVYILISAVCLLCLASFISAQSLTAPAEVPTDLKTVFTNIANGVATLITSLGAVMIIVAGILYLTSAGNPAKVETAKKALMYAVAGIVIGLAANVIVEIASDMVSGGTSSIDILKNNV